MNEVVIVFAQLTSNPDTPDSPYVSTTVLKYEVECTVEEFKAHIEKLGCPPIVGGGLMIEKNPLGD